MEQKHRALVSLMAGRVVLDSEITEVFDLEAERNLDMGDDVGRHRLAPHVQRDDCAVNRSEDGNKFCLFGDEEGKCFCLTTDGRLFDGFDPASSTHFSGYVDDGEISLYDYSQSDYFRFRL